VADEPVSALAVLTGAQVASDDYDEIIDKSDHTDAPTGTNKQITMAERALAISALLNLAGTYQPLDSDLTAIAALSTTSFGRSLLAQADAAAARSTLVVPSTSEALLLAAGGATVQNVGGINSNVNTVAATGSTETLDTSVYAVHDCTMDQSCTFTFSNPATSGKNTTFMLILRGAFTPTLPGAVKWSGGAAPTYTTPSVYVFTTIDAGTNWLGQQVGKAFA
jgi:hypothetical protein